MSVSAPGVTSTVAATWVTVSEAEPETPAVIAVIVAVPLPTAVAVPLAATVATPVAEDVQVNVWPLIVLPFASFATALNARVSPNAASVTV